MLTVKLHFTHTLHSFLFLFSVSLTYCLVPFYSYYHLKENKDSVRKFFSQANIIILYPATLVLPVNLNTLAAPTNPSNCPEWWRKSSSCWRPPFQWKTGSWSGVWSAGWWGYGLHLGVPWHRQNWCPLCAWMSLWKKDRKTKEKLNKTQIYILKT